jgi:hypothetical protein
MTGGIARTATAGGFDAREVARDLLAGLDGSELQLVVVFADWRIDSAVLAKALQEKLPAPVVGCTTIGVIGGPHDDHGHASPPSAAAIGFYGNWLRVGIGIASELPKSALARSRDAVHQAAAALGTTVEALDPARHVAITLVDGTSGAEEGFCIASAATAPQIRVVGGCAATELGSQRRAYVWSNGEALADAGIVLILETTLPFEAVTSQHMLATDVKTVVTAATGRTLEELDGRPAADRLRELIGQLGGKLDETQPSEYSFARFVDGVPYLRSMTQIEGSRIHLACGVATGHVLRLMRPGDLIQKTQQDLASVRDRLGGEISAFLAFSCIGRHWEAASRGLEQPLGDAYARYSTIGFQSYGEQTGMLLVNHTLTGLAIGVAP